MIQIRRKAYGVELAGTVTDKQAAGIRRIRTCTYARDVGIGGGDSMREDVNLDTPHYLNQARRHLSTLLQLLLLITVQQLIASLWYAGRYMHLIAETVDPTHWQFWFHWNDYWIFLKYLSWPGNSGTPIAIEGQVVGVIVVAIGIFVWRKR